MTSTPTPAAEDESITPDSVARRRDEIIDLCVQVVMEDCLRHLRFGGEFAELHPAIRRDIGVTVDAAMKLSRDEADYYSNPTHLIVMADEVVNRIMDAFEGDAEIGYRISRIEAIVMRLIILVLCMKDASPVPKP
jgi:hypothetical protein